jgi:hypothetical protein
MASVPRGIWSHGVPGELEPQPGPAHSYRLSAGSVAHFPEVQQAAEERGFMGIFHENPSGAKAHFDFAAFSARRKSCRDTNRRSSAVGLAPPNAGILLAYWRIPPTSFPSEKMKRGLYV